jgi:hypothetical protein
VVVGHLYSHWRSKPYRPLSRERGKDQGREKAEDNNGDLKRKMEDAIKAEKTALQDQKNNTEVFAKQFVSITLVICDSCTFVKDPDGFTKFAGLPDTQRFIALPQIHAFEFLRAIAADFIVPPTASNLTVGILYRCNTCLLTRNFSSGVVHLRRDFLRQLK